MKNHYATSILHNNHLFGFDNSILKCIDAQSGEEKWKARGYGKGTLIYADGRFIVLGEKGNLGLIDASTESFREISQFKALKGKCWTVPTITDGNLYLRNERKVACYDISGPL